MTQMFSVVRIGALAPAYGAMLVILRKWVITCCNMKTVALHKGNRSHKAVSALFFALHLFIYFSLGSEMVKDSFSITYSAAFSHLFDYLVIVVFCIILLGFGITGGFMLHILIQMQRNREKLQMIASNSSTEFVKKLALALSIFLFCNLWRLIDFTIYTWAKTSDGKWLYTSTMQVELYPLETTFPECFPLAFCCLLYRVRLPREKKKV
jgi:hypothetical protein